VFFCTDSKEREIINMGEDATFIIKVVVMGIENVAHIYLLPVPDSQINL
jgi:hypothetical protein